MRPRDILIPVVAVGLAACAPGSASSEHAPVPTTTTIEMAVPGRDPEPTRLSNIGCNAARALLSDVNVLLRGGEEGAKVTSQQIADEADILLQTVEPGGYIVMNALGMQIAAAWSTTEHAIHGDATESLLPNTQINTGMAVQARAEVEKALAVGGCE